jgi:tetratricopeptide (TPR) repeat protein
VQHWLEDIAADAPRTDGVFFWSFYRGKDADLCLRQLLADVISAAVLPEVSASYCVDRLLQLLRCRKWVVILDGVEVVQHESGPWFGRLTHPELSRLLEELASEPMPGVVVVTTRFPLPELEKRRHARLLSLTSLEPESSRQLLRSLGVHGADAELDEAAASCGRHAKAVELLGTYLVGYQDSAAARHRDLPESRPDDAADEERHVARVLTAHQQALTAEARDILALATAFREPPTMAGLLQYLRSEPVHTLLHQTWGRTYPALGGRRDGWLESEIRRLIALRLLEEVDAAGPGSGRRVLDAHPLVRRGFEHALGVAGRRQSATARAGYLRGRPDRRKPANLEEAREDVELFGAYCDAGLWEEADRAYRALDRPRYRFIAPALERDLLLRFFPDGDWRQPPLWPGFAHWRGLAVCLEMLGRFEDALAVYREADAALRGDALIALGQLGPVLEHEQAAHPWQVLWRAYRAHALCLAGRIEEGVALASALVPVDVYEWTHVFECLLRAGCLHALDMRSFLYRPATAGGHRWADLARTRMRLDYLRIRSPDQLDLQREYPPLIEAYDRAGLPYERTLARLSYARGLLQQGRCEDAEPIAAAAVELAQRYVMPLVAADGWDLVADITGRLGQPVRQSMGRDNARQLRAGCQAFGPPRP